MKILEFEYVECIDDLKMRYTSKPKGTGDHGTKEKDGKLIFSKKEKVIDDEETILSTELRMLDESLSDSNDGPNLSFKEVDMLKCLKEIKGMSRYELDMSTISEKMNESDLFEEGEYQKKLVECNFSTILDSGEGSLVGEPEDSNFINVTTIDTDQKDTNKEKQIFFEKLEQQRRLMIEIDKEINWEKYYFKEEPIKKEELVMKPAPIRREEQFKKLDEIKLLDTIKKEDLKQDLSQNICFEEASSYYSFGNKYAGTELNEDLLDSGEPYFTKINETKVKMRQSKRFQEQETEDIVQFTDPFECSETKFANLRNTLASEADLERIPFERSYSDRSNSGLDSDMEKSASYNTSSRNKKYFEIRVNKKNMLQNKLANFSKVAVGNRENQHLEASKLFQTQGGSKTKPTDRQRRATPQFDYTLYAFGSTFNKNK